MSIKKDCCAKDLSEACFVLRDADQKKLLLMYEKVIQTCCNLNCSHIKDMNTMVNIQYTLFGGRNYIASFQEKLFEIVNNQDKGIKAVARQSIFFIIKAAFERMTSSTVKPRNIISEFILNLVFAKVPDDFIHNFANISSFFSKDKDFSKKYLLVKVDNIIDLNVYGVLYLVTTNVANAIGSTVIRLDESVISLVHLQDMVAFEYLTGIMSNHLLYLPILNPCWEVKDVCILSKITPDPNVLSRLGIFKCVSDKLYHVPYSKITPFQISVVINNFSKELEQMNKLSYSRRTGDCCGITLCFESRHALTLRFIKADFLKFASQDLIKVEQGNATRVYVEVLFNNNNAKIQLFGCKEFNQTFNLILKLRIE